MKRLSTGVIVTRTKKNGVEVIRAYTPREWEYKRKAIKWWHYTKQTVNSIING